jgi:hypothetical protein
MWQVFVKLSWPSASTRSRLGQPQCGLRQISTFQEFLPESVAATRATLLDGQEQTRLPAKPARVSRLLGDPADPPCATPKQMNPGLPERPETKFAQFNDGKPDGEAVTKTYFAAMHPPKTRILSSPITRLDARMRRI